MKRVVVIGGGFAGSCVAQKLEKDFSVTLIDSKNFFEFTPGVLRTIVFPEHMKKIQVLHEHYLHKTKVVVGCISKVFEKEVEVDGKKRIGFDYLVIASGSKYTLPFKDWTVVATRAKHLRESYDGLCKAKKVLIIGGGLVGVELAGEICFAFPDKEITIVHSKDRLIERNNQKAISYAHKFLESHGVKILFNEKLEEGKRSKFVTSKGTKLDADIAFLCTGIKPNFDFLPKDFLDSQGGVKVNDCLQVFGQEKVFAAGDVVSIKEEKTAQTAERHAEVVVENIRALEFGSRRLRNYSGGKKRPLLISLGAKKGILSWGDFVLTGRVPAWMKSFVEWWEVRKKR